LGRCRHQQADGDDEVFGIFHDAVCCLSNTRTLSTRVAASIVIYFPPTAYNSDKAAHRPPLTDQQADQTARAKIRWSSDGPKFRVSFRTSVPQCIPARRQAAAPAFA
jgi:hypothetical protein